MDDLFKVISGELKYLISTTTQIKPTPALHHLCVLCLFSSASQSLTDVSADRYRGLWGD